MVHVGRTRACVWPRVPVHAGVCVCLSPCINSYRRVPWICLDINTRVRRCVPTPQGAHVCVNACAHPYPRRNARALSVGVDGVWFGSQAFFGASAFNANIGAWNTARVITLGWVCTAYGVRRGGHARWGFDAARLLCAAAPPMRACVCLRAHTCGHSDARLSTWVCIGHNDIYI